MVTVETGKSTGPDDGLLDRLVGACSKGATFVLRDSWTTEGEERLSEARQMDESTHLRADTIRSLLLGRDPRTGAEVTPRAIIIRGARLDQRLQLENLESQIQLEFQQCYFPSGVSVIGSRLYSIHFHDCLFETVEGEAAFDADGLETRGNLNLSGDFYSSEMGACIRFGAALVGGDANLLLCLRPKDAEPRGEIGTWGVFADGFSVRRRLVVEGRYEGDWSRAALTFKGAQVGEFSANLDIVNPSGGGLHADRMSAEANILLFANVRNSSSLASLRLPLAFAGGNIDIKGEYVNDLGSALVGNRWHATSVCVIKGNFIGNDSDGAISVMGARFGAQLHAEFYAENRNEGGFAFGGDGMTCDSIAEISGTAIGAVRLLDADIRVSLTMDLDVTSGAAPAFAADRMRAASVLLAGQYSSNSGLSTVQLPSCEISRTLTIAAGIATDSGSALDLSDANIGNDLILDCDMIDNDTDSPTVLLEGCRIVNALDVGRLGDLSVNNYEQKWTLEGLEFGVLTGMERADWLELIRWGTPVFSAQPYAHLSRLSVDAGRDDEARRVLVSRGKDQLRRAKLGLPTRVWLYVWGITVGFGYRPWLALLWLLGIIGVGVVGTLVVSARHLGLVPTGHSEEQLHSSPQVGCGPLEQIAWTADSILPIVDLSTDCFVAGGVWGGILQIGVGTLQILSWALLTLFVAGFTQLVRKPSD